MMRTHMWRHRRNIFGYVADVIEMLARHSNLRLTVTDGRDFGDIVRKAVYSMRRAYADDNEPIMTRSFKVQLEQIPGQCTAALYIWLQRTCGFVLDVPAVEDISAVFTNCTAISYIPAIRGTWQVRDITGYSGALTLEDGYAFSAVFEAVEKRNDANPMAFTIARAAKQRSRSVVL